MKQELTNPCHHYRNPVKYYKGVIDFCRIGQDDYTFIANRIAYLLPCLNAQNPGRPLRDQVLLDL